MTRRLFACLPLAAAASAAAPPAKAPIASSPVVEVRGSIAKVEIARGQGMPCLDVTTAKGQVKLVLGSMRYLVEQDFNPRAGERVEAKGYQMGDHVVAIRVELPDSNRKLQLRDENGWPLWMRGGRGPGQAGKQ